MMWNCQRIVKILKRILKFCARTGHLHVVVDATEYSISLFLQGDEAYLTFSELSWGVSLKPRKSTLRRFI